MFNIKTLLSVFNEQGTLLKWLQKVEEALKNDTLTGVTVSQPTTTTAVLTFTFKDGTTLDSAVIDLPPGAPGINGTNGTDGAIHALGTHNLTGPDGNSFKLSMIFSANGILKPGQIVLFSGDETENGKLYKYVGERNLFGTSWKPWNAADWEYQGSFKGDPGKDGNGIVSINSEASYVSGNDTITPITIETDDSTEQITVSARNGTDGTNGADGFIQHRAQYNRYSADNVTIVVFKRYNDNTDTTLKKGSYVMIVDQYNYKDSIIGLVPEYFGEDIPFIGNSIELPVTDFAIGNSTLRLRGADGVGIESITTLGYRAGTGANIGYTETMLKAHMSDNTDIDLSVFAKDGIDNTQQLLTDIKIANLGKYNVFAENTNNYGFTYNDTSEKFKAKKFYLTNSSDTSSQSISISTSGATISSSKILYCVEKGRFLTNSEVLEKSETLTLIVFQKENLTITIS